MSYIMPFGKYKFTNIQELPAHYLLSIYGQEEIMTKYPEIKEYIETQLSALIRPKAKIGLIPDPLCNKICYIDEEAADKALILINHDKRNHIKPHRAYLHRACGFWHLTSEPLREKGVDEE